MSSSAADLQAKPGPPPFPPAGKRLGPPDLAAAERRRQRLYRRAERTLTAFFDRQQKVVVERLGGPALTKGTRHWTDSDYDLKRGISKVGTKALDAAKAFDRDRWRNQLATDARPLIEDAFEAGGNDWDLELDIDDEDVQDSVSDWVTAVSDLSDDLADDIEDLVNLGDEKDEALPVIIAGVAGLYAAHKDKAVTAMSERISTSVPNHGALLAARQMVARATPATDEDTGDEEGGPRTLRGTGPQLVKEWVSMRDDRVRPSHADADGQTQNLDDPFEVGEELLDFPGDPNGAPGETFNCLPAGQMVQLPGLRYSYRRWYEGELVKLRFASGHRLTVTPNHPVLRSDGEWVPAGALNPGDDCVSGRLMGEPLGEPHVECPPAEVSEVHRAATLTGHTQRVGGSPPNFHGDGRDGQVEVAAAHGHLRDERDAASDEQVAQFGFAVAGRAQRAALGDGAAARRAFSRTGQVCRFGRDGAARTVRGGGQDTATLDIGAVHTQPHALRQTSPLYARFGQPTAYDAAVHAQRSGDGEFAFAAEVSLDQLVHVERVASWAGWVYNFDTGHGWYLSHSGNGPGVFLRNCRCVLVFVVPGEEKRLDPTLEVKAGPDTEERDDHGRWTAGGGIAPAAIDAKADGFATSHRLTPGSPPAFERASIVWAATFAGCDGVQDAADAYVGAGGEVRDGEYAFAAREILDAISDPAAPGHMEVDRPLYRGMRDPDGSIAAHFTAGSEVSVGLASFATMPHAVDKYAAAGAPGDHETVLVTSGRVQGADVTTAMRRQGFMVSDGEVVSGGTFKVLSAEEGSGPSGAPRTTITLAQMATPKVTR